MHALLAIARARIVPWYYDMHVDTIVVFEILDMHVHRNSKQLAHPVSDSYSIQSLFCEVAQLV